MLVPIWARSRRFATLPSDCCREDNARISNSREGVVVPDVIPDLGDEGNCLLIPPWVTNDPSPCANHRWCLSGCRGGRVFVRSDFKLTRRSGFLTSLLFPPWVTLGCVEHPLTSYVMFCTRTIVEDSCTFPIGSKAFLATRNTNEIFLLSSFYPLFSF
jgi:hypothetical protein